MINTNPIVPTRHTTILNTTLMVILTLAIAQPLALAGFPQLCGFIILGILYTYKHFSFDVPKRLIWSLVAICTLCSLSSLWSVTPAASFSRSIKITGTLLFSIPLLIGLASLPEAPKKFIRSYFAIPLLIAGMYLWIELTFDFPIWHIIRDKNAAYSTWQLNKHVSVFTLLLPFGLYYSWQEKRKDLAFLLGLLAIGILVVTASQASQLAVFGMIIAVIGLYLLPRLALPLCFLTCGSIFIGLPWGAASLYDLFADKIGEGNIMREAATSTRLEVWDFIAKKVQENPLIGYGLDCTRSMDFQSRMVYYRDTGIMHPHSIALQLWIEFGLIGCVMGCSILSFIYRSISLLPRAQQYLPTAVFSGSMIYLLASWSIWSSWLLGLMMLLLALCSFAKTDISPEAET